MAQNGTPVDFLGTVDLFADTMSETHLNRGNANSMLIIATDGKATARYLDGDDDSLLDAISTALYNDSELFKVIEAALALTITAKLKAEDDDTD